MNLKAMLKPTLLAALALAMAVCTGGVAVHDCQKTPAPVTTDGGPPPAPTHYGAFPGLHTYAWVNIFDGASSGAYPGNLSFNGHLVGLHCVLQTVNAAPLYVQCFDIGGGATPSPGATPLPGCVSGALVSVGNDVSFSDTEYMSFQHGGGSLPLVNGLAVALSTTTGTLTAPGAGNTAHCDALVGP